MGWRGHREQVRSPRGSLVRFRFSGDQGHKKNPGSERGLPPLRPEWVGWREKREGSCRGEGSLVWELRGPGPGQWRGGGCVFDFRGIRRTGSGRGRVRNEGGHSFP